MSDIDQTWAATSASNANISATDAIPASPELQRRIMENVEAFRPIAPPADKTAQNRLIISVICFLAVSIVTAAVLAIYR